MAPGIRGEKWKSPEGPCGKALTWWCALVSLSCSLPAVQTAAVARNESLDGISSPNGGARGDVLQSISPCMEFIYKMGRRDRVEL